MSHSAMTPCTILKALRRAICLGCLKFLFIKVAVTWSRLYRRSCITETTETLREPWRKKENSENVEPARSHKRATRSGNRRWYGVGSDHRTWHCFFSFELPLRLFFRPVHSPNCVAQPSPRPLRSSKNAACTLVSIILSTELLKTGNILFGF